MIQQRHQYLVLGACVHGLSVGHGATVDSTPNLDYGCALHLECCTHYHRKVLR